MRDIRDRDHQPETIAVRFAVHGIVEILGVIAIDRDQWKIAQVHARGRGGDFHVDRNRGSLR